MLSNWFTSQNRISRRLLPNDVFHLGLIASPLFAKRAYPASKPHTQENLQTVAVSSDDICTRMGIEVHSGGYRFPVRRTHAERTSPKKFFEKH